MLQFTFDEVTQTALIHEGLLTPDQLSKARDLAHKLGGQTTIGDVLLDMNLISRQRLDEFVRRHRNRLSLSDILISRHLVTDNDVRAAREIQRKSTPKSKRIGETLVEMGLIEERHVVEALSHKFHLPLLDPDITEIDFELVRKVSLKYLRRQVALPIKLDAGELHLLVADPTMTHFIEEIERLFTCRVKLALATSATISQKLDLVDALLQSKDAGISDYQKVKYHTLEAQASQTGEDRVIQMVDQLIKSAIEEGASDVHLEPMANKLRVRYRIDGVLVHKVDFPRDYIPRIISRIKILADADVAERRKHQDGRIFVKTARVIRECKICLPSIQPLSLRHRCRNALYTLYRRSLVTAFAGATAAHRLESRPSSRMMRIHANGQRQSPPHRCSAFDAQRGDRRSSSYCAAE